MIDRVSHYARKVRDGKIVAGRMVRLACLRHLDDLQHQKERGLRWSPKDAAKVIQFFDEVLCLPEESAAGDDDDDAPDLEVEASRFTLAPWQEFIVGSLVGWHRSSGYRRFRTAYLETAKGSGKTPLCAGLLLYLLVSDGDRGAQYFVAAVTREQAQIAFADIEKMVAASAPLRALMLSTKNNIAIPSKASFVRAISAEKRGLDGKRVSGAIIDELHEQPTPVVVNKIRKGTKSRRNALILEPTNAGFDRTTVCWNHHEYSRKVLERTVHADDWFAFIAALDPCQACQDAGKWFPDDDCKDCDDWRTEGPHWEKANPNLGISLPWQYLRDLVRQAQGMPSEVGDLLRFNFGVWTRGYHRAFDMGKWAACLPMPTDAELDGADGFGCLDLGETDDFSAWGRLWTLDDGRVAIKLRYFLPEIALERYPNRPYDEWQRAGLLTVTEGDVTDYATVRAQILDDYRSAGLRAVFYDTKTARETAQLLIAEGVDMVPITQGFPLHEAIKRTGELILSGNLCHGNDPILAWMASNAVLVTGSKNEKRLAKERSPEKIDGVAALLMGVDGAVVRREREPEPTYEMFMLGREQGRRP